MSTKPLSSERIAVAAMFVLVLVVFSFASRDTHRWNDLRSGTAVQLPDPVSKPQIATISSTEKLLFPATR